MKNFSLFSLQIKNIVLLLHRQNKAIGLWCNGNTTDSGPVILGSNPGSPTETIFFGRSFFCFMSARVGVGTACLRCRTHLCSNASIVQGCFSITAKLPTNPPTPLRISFLCRAPWFSLLAGWADMIVIYCSTYGLRLFVLNRLYASHSNPGSPTKTTLAWGSFFCFYRCWCKRVVVPTNVVAVHLSLMQAVYHNRRIYILVLGLAREKECLMNLGNLANL